MIFGQHEKNTLEQFHDIKSRASAAALMADGHLGYVMPIGGVAAYDNHVSPVGVGFDIACGNCAIRTDVDISDFGRTSRQRSVSLNKLADDIAAHISFGVGRSNLAKDAPTDDLLFADVDAWNVLKNRAGHGEYRRLYTKAKEQLGTVGSGNHYVDVFVDENNKVWVGVHFGSRGFGHGIATGFLNAGVTGDWHEKAKEQEVLFYMRSSIGEDYWTLMELAGRYAYVGREWVARQVVKLIGAKEVEMVHNHHNFAWKENHQLEGDTTSREYVVVRKGATPAFPDQKGFVGGSMGDNAVILKGTSYEADDFDAVNYLQEKALYSTVHGAGRVMGRAEAKRGKVIYDARGIPTGQRDESTKIDPEAMKEWLGREEVVLRGGDVDEAPQAYRRLPDVLRDQGSTITVLHTLKPLVVVMAGRNEFDPYKD